MMKLKLTLTRDVTKSECKWLSRDFEKGTEVFLYSGSTYGCVSKNGIACTLNGQLPFFELPEKALGILHEENEYGIFMTEKGPGYTAFYCKKNPFDAMLVLHEIQHRQTIPSKNENEIEENLIMKFTLKNNKLSSELIQLNDMAALF